MLAMGKISEETPLDHPKSPKKLGVTPVGVKFSEETGFLTLSA
jgi:hypothetical protein